MNAEVPETHIATIAMLRQLRLDQSAGGMVKVDGCPNQGYCGTNYRGYGYDI